MMKKINRLVEAVLLQPLTSIALFLRTLNINEKNQVVRVVIFNESCYIGNRLVFKLIKYFYKISMLIGLLLTALNISVKSNSWTA